jgi:hypothetical protein
MGLINSSRFFKEQVLNTGEAQKYLFPLLIINWYCTDLCLNMEFQLLKSVQHFNCFNTLF